jgi:hypothetical protein
MVQDAIELSAAAIDPHAAKKIIAINKQQDQQGK